MILTSVVVNMGNTKTIDGCGCCGVEGVNCCRCTSWGGETVANCSSVEIVEVSDSSGSVIVKPQEKYLGYNNLYLSKIIYANPDGSHLVPGGRDPITNKQLWLPGIKLKITVSGSAGLHVAGLIPARHPNLNHSNPTKTHSCCCGLFCPELNSISNDKCFDPEGEKDQCCVGNAGSEAEVWNTSNILFAPYDNDAYAADPVANWNNGKFFSPIEKLRSAGPRTNPVFENSFPFGMKCFNVRNFRTAHVNSENEDILTNTDYAYNLLPAYYLVFYNFLDFNVELDWASGAFQFEAIGGDLDDGLDNDCSGYVLKNSYGGWCKKPSDCNC